MTLNCYKFEFSREFRAISQIWKATTAKRMKIDSYCQRQNFSPAHQMYFSTMYRLRWFFWAFLRYGSIRQISQNQWAKMAIF